MYENYTILGFSEERVLELFLDLKRHYFAEITKKTSLTRPRTLRALKKLTKNSILTINPEANIKYYSLNKNPLTYTTLSMVEYNKTTMFLEKNRILKRAIEMFRAEYKDYLSLILFGSYAKGYASKNSDIDLLVVKEAISKAEIKKIEEIAEVINGRTGLKISPYLIKKGELGGKKDFVNEVIGHHLIIEGGELFFKLALE